MTETQDESRTHEIKDNVSIATRKSFIANAKNKAALQKCLAETWCLEMCSVSLEASPVNLSSFKEMDHKPYQICHVNLTRKQIHVSLHMQHYGYSHAVVQATDTDIRVVAIYQSVRIPGL